MARVAGGWRPAIGLDGPRLADGRTALVGLVQQIGARFAAAFVFGILVVATHNQKTPISNVAGLDQLSAGAAAAVAVAAAVLAPIAEEMIFRGLVLRALMRRLPFVPSALISSALFGALHSVQGGTWIAAVGPAFFTAVFGVVQCLIVRRTGRLAPAMLVHGTANAIMIAIAVA